MSGTATVTPPYTAPYVSDGPCPCCGGTCCSIPDGSTFQVTFAGITVPISCYSALGSSVLVVSCTPNNTYCCHFIGGPPTFDVKFWEAANDNVMDTKTYGVPFCTGIPDVESVGANAYVWCDEGTWHVAFGQSGDFEGIAFYGNFTWDCTTSPIVVSNAIILGDLYKLPVTASAFPTYKGAFGIGTGGTATITFNGC